MASAKTVLVVDDDQELLDLVSMVLDVEGYRMETALDGQEALASIERKMPDLILLDMKMPVMNGWQFAEAFHTLYDHKAPIIVLTASQSAKRMAEEIGANGWIGKPFEMDQLLDTVRKHT
jgi:CheY-like chemotaxis protein